MSDACNAHGSDSESILQEVHSAASQAEQCVSTDEANLSAARNKASNALSRHRSFIASLPSHSSERAHAERAHASARQRFTIASANVVSTERSRSRGVTLGDSTTRSELLASSSSPTSRPLHDNAETEHEASSGLQRARTVLQKELQKNDERRATVERSIHRLEQLRSEYDMQRARMQRGNKMLSRISTEQMKERALMAMGLAFFLVVFTRVLARRVPGVGSSLAMLTKRRSNDLPYVHGLHTVNNAAAGSIGDDDAVHRAQHLRGNAEPSEEAIEELTNEL